MLINFNDLLPVYNIVTPQTKLELSIRSLTIAEEERLKASILVPTPGKVTEHLNNCLFGTIVNKPERMKNYENFLKSLTIPDRDALLYGLYHITYEEERIYNISCSQCGHEHSVIINADKTFNINLYPGEDILKARVVVPLNNNLAVVLKQPTLADERFAYNNLLQRPIDSNDIYVNSMMIDKIVELTGKKDDIPDEKNAITNREDILDAFLSFPAKTRKIIYKAFYKEFGQYCIELKMNTICPKCGFNEVKNIDLLSQFFRLVFE